MNTLSISEAAEILGVTRKTLIRWDDADKFSPERREDVTGARVYDRSKVEDLAKVRKNETEYRSVLKNLKNVRSELNSYELNRKLHFPDEFRELKEREIRLLDKETELDEKKDNFLKEFFSFPDRLKKLYKALYMNKK